MNFVRTLDIALRARQTLVVAVTREETRVIEQIRSLCADAGRPLVVWDAAHGFVPPTVKPIRDPLTALDEVALSDDATVYVLRDFHDMWSNAVVRRKLRNTVQQLRRGRRAVVVTTPSPHVPPELVDEALIVDIGLPDADERRAALDRFCAAPGLRVGLTDLGREKLASAAAGLSLEQMRRQLAGCVVESGVLDDRHIEAMAQAKAQVLRDHEGIEYYGATCLPDEVGGLDVLKQWLRSRERAFSRAARDYGLPPPRGIALLGIPGTGKSLTARVIGQLWHMPLLRLDVGGLFGSLVGESEERLRRALRVAETVSPCVLWIDELDKAVPAGAVDGGTSARVLGTLLTWMQEKTAPCFVVATANRVDVLPPELLRRGRFDEIFFLDLPTSGERKEIFEVHLRKRGRLPCDFDASMLAKQSEGFVGAEIEQAVLDAMFVAFNEEREFTTDDVLAALRRLIPLSQSQREAVGRLRTWLTEGRAQSATFREANEAVRRFVPCEFERFVKEN